MKREVKLQEISPPLPCLSFGWVLFSLFVFIKFHTVLEPKECFLLAYGF